MTDTEILLQLWADILADIAKAMASQWSTI